MFCQDVIHADMEHLKRTATRNSVLGPFRDGEGVVLEGFDPTGEHGRIEEVFGTCDGSYSHCFTVLLTPTAQDTMTIRLVFVEYACRLITIFIHAA